MMHCVTRLMHQKLVAATPHSMQQQQATPANQTQLQHQAVIMMQ
jgi:hypothetical protein